MNGFLYIYSYDYCFIVQDSSSSAEIICFKPDTKIGNPERLYLTEEENEEETNISSENPVDKETQSSDSIEVIAQRMPKDMQREIIQVREWWIMDDW